MVSAKKGYLLRCDVPAKVFIVQLNAQYKAQGKKEFLINDLDERTLLVHAPYLDEILLEWKKYIDAITYQPPDKNALAQQQQ